MSSYGMWFLRCLKESNAMKSLIRMSCVLTLAITVLPLSAQTISSTLVISQIYLGTGGNFAPKSQYVEIFNRGTKTIDASGATRATEHVPFSIVLYEIIHINMDGGI